MWWLTNYIDEKLTNCAEEIMINDAVCMCAVLGCVVVAQMKHSSASFSCFFYCAAAVGSTVVASDETILGSAERKIKDENVIFSKFDQVI